MHVLQSNLLSTKALKKSRYSNYFVESRCLEIHNERARDIKMSGRKSESRQAAKSSSSASAKKTKAEILGQVSNGGKKRRKRYEDATFDGGFNQDEDDEERAQPVLTEPITLNVNAHEYMDVDNLDVNANTAESDTVPYFSGDSAEMAEGSMQRTKKGRAFSAVKKFLQKNTLVHLSDSALGRGAQLRAAKDEKIMAILGSHIANVSAVSGTSATDGGIIRVPSQPGIEEATDGSAYQVSMEEGQDENRPCAHSILANSAINTKKKFRVALRGVQQTLVLPYCFGPSRGYSMHTVYLKKSNRGVGLKVRLIDDRIVVRGFAEWFAPGINLRVNDVLLGVNSLDARESNPAKMMKAFEFTGPASSAGERMLMGLSIVDDTVCLRVARPDIWEGEEDVAEPRVHEENTVEQGVEEEKESSLGESESRTRRGRSGNFSSSADAVSMGPHPDRQTAAVTKGRPRVAVKVVTKK